MAIELKASIFKLQNFVRNSPYSIFHRRFRFVPASIDNLFRSLVRINKESRSKDFQSHDILQMLFQIQTKHST